jgi:predicted esterase YcpF (UPF0227 family)
MGNKMIVYLHGLNSSGTGPKTDALIKRFGKENVVSPDLPIIPKQVENIVGKIVRETKNFPIVFVGTSLGGFWANYFAQLWDTRCVIVNPAILPSQELPSLGVSKNIANLYKPYEVRIYGDMLNGNRISLFAAKDDDVIPYDEMLKAFPNTASTIVTNTGGHRYLSNWNAVMDRVAEILE